MTFKTLLATTLAACSFAHAQPAATQPTSSIRYIGGDVSMVPELERFGAVWESACGDKEDAISILRADDWNLFRVRVFVDPSTDFDATWGATQSLEVVRALCKRIDKLGGKVFLCIHYSDTWADPEHQTKPKAWKDLPFDQLEKRVHDYTASVLKALKDDGVVPEIVQVGNEITAGMLWPDGKVFGVPEAERPGQWSKLSRLINAGVRAVREASTAEKPIHVAVHVHGGGKAKLQAGFFDRLENVDFDMIGVSFYPAWGESLDVLQKQLVSLRETSGKEVLVAETAYPHKDVKIEEKYQPFLKWPLTPDGQAKFAQDLRRAVERAGSVGIVWWYPEAIPVKGHDVYRNGAEGLFDEKGRRLDTVDRLIGLN